MAHPKIKRALISVYDKTGIVDFARALHGEFGIEIISTGGTAKLLKESGIPVTLVEEITGFPEMLDGRVKTLHPRIHAAILADRDNSEHMRQLEQQRIKPIDMVVVNLYPFEKTVADANCTFDQAIEMIDIGGPCLLRAAAKNQKHVLPVYDPEAYVEVVRVLRGEWGEAQINARYGSGSFGVTCCYDGDVASWLGENSGIKTPPFYHFPAYNWGDLRYGENPHQRARLLQSIENLVTPTPANDLTLADAESDMQEQSRMSYNNYADAHAALELCSELARASASAKVCAFIKHTNACGVGVADNAGEAYRRAYLGDPNAAMGGILACSFEVGSEFARTVMETYDRWGKAAGAGGFFVEVWVAPGFDDAAVQAIRTLKPWGQRVRLLSVGTMTVHPDPAEMEYRSITGGMLVQSRDTVGLNEDQWKVVTKRAPTVAERAELRLAWLIAKHTKSNAISICKDGMLIGNGAGQMSRVMSCRIATWLAKENRHEDKLSGAAAASDAFFPFADGPNLLMDAGVTAMIQPGGSKRDQEVIDACDARGGAMIFTGTRHFKH